MRYNEKCRENGTHNRRYARAQRCRACQACVVKQGRNRLQNAWNADTSKAAPLKPAVIGAAGLAFYGVAISDDAVLAPPTTNEAL
jgi:hypothetical protein